MTTISLLLFYKIKMTRPKPNSNLFTFTRFIHVCAYMYVLTIYPTLIKINK